MTTIRLTAEGEHAWQRLKKHIEWTDGFLIGFIFTEHPQIISLFRDRLADIFRARITRLQFILPEDPGSLTTEALRRLVHPYPHETEAAGPVWMDLTRPDGDAWHDERIAFVARLNEHREPLRQHLGKPLVLIFPAREKSDVRRMAPDLWTIRSFTIDTTAALFTQDSFPAPVVPSPELPIRRELSEYEHAILSEWERLSENSITGRGILAPGLRAIKLLLASGEYEKARMAIEHLLPVAREHVQDTGGLRTLSTVLDNVGKIARIWGKWDEAKLSFDESLTISRKIMAAVGETPEALRDICVSLSNVGEAAVALQQSGTARNAFKEGLTIARLLADRFPDLPEFSKLPDHFIKCIDNLNTQ